MLAVLGMRAKVVVKDVSYEQYLGSAEQQKKCQSPETKTDPRVPKRGNGRASTVIVNHTGFSEGWTLPAAPLHTALLAQDAMERIPVYGTILTAFSSLYVNRGSDQASRDAIVQTIIDRQNAIEVDNSPLRSIGIFAEGTTSNNTSILPFKRGAFQGMRTIVPTAFNIDYGQISPCYDTVPMHVIFVLLMSSLDLINCTTTIMPEFTPNTVMLEKHADKGKDPAEVYAWCIRDIISKASGLPKDDNASFRTKKVYTEYMQKKVDFIEVDGV